MAEGGLKGSRSAEGLDKPGKPGKLSSDLLNKFESDPSLSGPQPLTVGHSRLSTQSFTSSSEEIATSQENVKSTSATVRIKIPDQNEDHLSPSSGDEGMFSDDEGGKDKKKKKRKYRWKWSPFKKMKKLFRRKKSPTRVKSCEELPRERYKPTYASSEQEDNDSLRTRTKSEPSLVETKTKSPLAAIEVYERRNTVDNPVQRTKSEPSRQSLGRLLKNVKVQGKSQDSISEEPAMSSDERESQTGSITTGLDWTMISSDSGTEAAVSFESLPRASSLEGLQAAHDRIKIAPKHRRPPTRAHPNSSSMNIKRNPTKPHRRSRTDPKDMSAKTSVETESNEELASNRNSDIVNATIFEALESSEEQSKEKVLADMKAKASDILARVQEPPKESGTSTIDEVVAEIVQDKEDHTEAEGEENKESTEQHVKVLDENEMDNKDNVVINKENEDVQPTKPDVQMENKEESKAKETILKELNVRKEGSRPMLDMSRRSKSLGKNFGKKESAMKPPMPNRFSLDRIDQNIDNSEGTNTAALELRKLVEKEKSIKTESVHEEKSNDSQNSGEKTTPVDDSKLRSKDSTPSSPVKSSDADKTPTGTKLKGKPTEQDNTSDQPDWIKLATKKSARLSQLLDSKDVQASLNVDTDSSSSPALTSDNKGNKLKPAVKEKPKIATKPQGLTNKKNSPDAPQFGSKTPNIEVDKKVPFRKSLSEEETNKDKALSQVSSTGKSVSSDKCVVCGRTVYQMEKCNFDSSVLHRQCVKCSVCNRLLTVGNFVITESKVYCKPHGQAISVSL
ncbi:peptidyl-prolyl cis-trans isomerase G-like isoform X2 [Orbicella faveolata]|uniref:peptidyl-prolyl cis-trans isomerase G-like isoform X1 n=1 Tax=Orbicella faveolata TaxID=48498 RepID=UPI0009E2FFFA|nr:peptidyl-prolyl cis-trans isomerase G-like isoform X1 [Orbicella faveolata]XP_020616041.1 peptidyl-prolyl cis-trans isomerase G-like isoform X2 [Orbicella faveolata]